MAKKEKELFQILDWDTEHFGYRVARINPHSLSSDQLKDILAKLLGNEVRLGYWFTHPDDSQSNKAARESHGLLADEKTTYVRTLPKDAERLQLDDNIKSYLHKSLNDHLLNLALLAGEYSRFRLDPNCIHHEFEILYTEWIKNSLSGKMAKDVLVYSENGAEIGFVTIGEKEGYGNIGLIAVDEKFQGQSIGKKLVDAAFKKADQLGFDKIEVVAQKQNAEACRFYEHLGFKIDSVQNIYHFWLNG